MTAWDRRNVDHSEARCGPHCIGAEMSSEECRASVCERGGGAWLRGRMSRLKSDMFIVEDLLASCKHSVHEFCLLVRSENKLKWNEIELKMFGKNEIEMNHVKYFESEMKSWSHFENFLKSKVQELFWGFEILEIGF